MAKVARQGDQIVPFDDYGMGFGFDNSAIDDTSGGTRPLSTTKVNGLAIARQGAYTGSHRHFWAGHLIWIDGYFPPGSTGSPSVFADSVKVLRVGDIANCGCIINAGSPNVDAL